jgi:hypothetical protein
VVLTSLKLIKTSRDSWKTEPTLARADFLVELRGFEPMAIAGAVRSRR